MFCVASGIYLPTVTWRRGQEVLSNSSTLTIFETTETNSVVNSSLTISVFTRSDAGQYSCDVTNEAGNDTASFELIILGTSQLFKIIVAIFWSLKTWSVMVRIPVNYRHCQDVC